MPGIWAEAGELLYHCRNNLKFLDVTLDSILNTPGHEPDTEEFCKGLHGLKTLTHIVVRKPNNVYLTRPKLQLVLSEMAKATYKWTDLEYVDLSFRLSDDSGGTAAILTMLPIPVPAHRPRSAKLPGPVTQLTQALSTRPKLHTFSTHLPNVWNENILRVSQNPVLERIILVDGVGDAKDGTFSDQCLSSVCGSGIVVGTGHFFAQARRHARLSELIRAGTSISRGRAQTLGTSSGYSVGYQTHPSHPLPSCGVPSRLQDNQHGRGMDSSLSARTSWQISHSWEYYSSSGAMASPSLPLTLSTSAP